MAIATLVAFLAAFEVLPGLHLATHEHLGAHHHDASGAIIRDDNPAHTHDDAVAHVHRERHVFPRPPRDQVGDREARETRPVGTQHDRDREQTTDIRRGARDDDRDIAVDEHGHALDVTAARSLAKSRRALPTDVSYLLATALEHGRGSLAHHAAAVRTPSPVVTVPLPVDRRPTSVVTDTIVVLRSVAPFTARARGPPVAALAVI